MMYFTKRFLLNVLLLTCISSLNGQIGGRYAYEFLALPSSARITALGGSVISVLDEDQNLAYSNPALLNPKMNHRISFNYNWHLADIRNGYISYAKTFEKLNLTAHAAIDYISYGDFVRADETGQQIGTFEGGETAIVLGAAKTYQERLNYGMNLKFIFSNLDGYKSFGLAADIGMNYTNENGDFNISAVIKNVGSEITSYIDEKYAAPLDIQIGLSKRLKHLPFRFSIIAHELQQWKIRYDDPSRKETTNIFGEVTEDSKFSQEIDNFFRHFIFSGEFLIGKNDGLKLRIGYNHLRRKELSISQFQSLAGFSLGFGLSVKGIVIDYGVGYHHIAGAANHLSISTNLGWFFKKV
ncbi:MAG TPA: type IX secretion system protein PorQ [Saprospiraceae bacterium]|nr:type IX secretion system protein PorQ [Saprospiraceae bacterium]